MAGGLIAKGTIPPEHLMVADPSAALREKHEANGVRVTADNLEVVEFAHVVVLAVKVSAAAACSWSVYF